MMNQREYSDSPIHRRGFTIIECLLGLALSAVLLTAVAMAFSASVTSYRDNESLFWAVNNARQALARMTSQLRMAGYEYKDPTLGEVWLSVAYTSGPSNQCTFWTAQGENLTYVFRNTDHKLCLRKEATGQEYVLCSGVGAAKFTMTNSIEDPSTATSVEIELTVESGSPQHSVQRTLSAAAAIRRNP